MWHPERLGVRTSRTLFIPIVLLACLLSGPLGALGRAGGAEPSVPGCHPGPHVVCIGRTDGGHSVHVVVGQTVTVGLAGSGLRWSDLRRDSTVDGLVLTLRDVTEQHELEEELKFQAFHDMLTGLPNRALFAREAAGALERRLTALGAIAAGMFDAMKFDFLFDPGTNVIDVHMARLRRKLEDNPARPRHLLTEPGMGYRYQP